jgi:hypothetical protein
MQEDKIYEYAVIRLVPKVERESFQYRTGDVFKKEKFIKVEFYLCPDKFKLMRSKIDYEDVIQNLESFKKIADGAKTEDRLHSLKFLKDSVG